MPTIATFSIVGRDPANGELGVAVQSKFLAVGSAVPWAKAGVGAIATQAAANLDYGIVGLQLLEKGYSAQQTMDALLALDEGREERQVGIVDAQGRSAAFTGSRCFDWAGHINGENFSAQGNILVSRETVQALADTFNGTEGPLAWRLVKALDAAQDAGGDRRGRQSAAVLVVKEGGSYGGHFDHLVDLRVDDDPEPIKKLMHLLELSDLYFHAPEVILPVDAAMAKEIQTALKARGYYDGEISGVYDEATSQAYYNWCGVENYEMRICEGANIDERIYGILTGK